MSDRRADARDTRLTDHDSTEPTGRDESKKVGRVTLDEIDWDSAPDRRVPYDVWMDRGSTPFPTGRREWWNDWPDVPTQIGDWRFRSGTTSNDYLTPGYLPDGGDGQFPRDLTDADTYVIFEDKREYDKGIGAYVVTPNVRVAAGALPHPRIVKAEDPETFVRRAVAHLDGIGPDEITHPRYDPSLERNLPDNWTFDELLPLATKTTFSWSGRTGGSGRLLAWAIDAEGSTTSGRPMDVFAYPIPSLGEKAPKVRPDDMGIDPMPGPGPGPAAETARRMMRYLNENPRRHRPSGIGTDTPDRKAAQDALSFTSPDGDNIEFFVGDVVRTVYNDSRTGNPEVIGGRLASWEFAEPDSTSTDDRGPIRIVVEPHENADDHGYIIRGRDVVRDRKIGKVLPGKLPIYLTRRGD